MHDEVVPSTGIATWRCRVHLASASRRSHTALPLSLMVAVAAVSVSACSMASDDVMATIALPSSSTAGRDVDAQPIGQLPAAQPGGVASAIEVSPKQRAYLDALTRGGVDSSSELLALSIGSYVCQAHAAHQSDQAVWDFVMPMVRDDVRDTTPGDLAPPAGQVNSVTADYIRIATDRLC